MDLTCHWKIQSDLLLRRRQTKIRALGSTLTSNRWHRTLFTGLSTTIKDNMFSFVLMTNPTNMLPWGDKWQNRHFYGGGRASKACFFFPPRYLCYIQFCWDYISVLAKNCRHLSQDRSQQLNRTLWIYLHIEESVHIIIRGWLFPPFAFFFFSFCQQHLIIS